MRAPLIWSAALDPAVLRVAAEPATSDVSLDLARHDHHLVVDDAGHEHVALRTGRGLLRLDVTNGTLRAGPAALHVELDCTLAILPKLAALDRLLRLFRIRDPGRRPEPPDPRLGRLVEGLRVADALASFAPRPVIAAELTGRDRADMDWPGAGEHLRSWLRRRIALARRLVAAGAAGVLQRRT